MMDLNLHSFKDQLKIKKEDGQVLLFDTIRKKYLVLQPEELVRQLFIHFLLENGYKKEKIQVEKGFNQNGLFKRFDIVVYDEGFKPYMLIECKSHHVKIDQKTFDQISRYNMVLGAPFLVVTNGVQTHCLEIDAEGKIVALANFPV